MHYNNVYLWGKKMNISSYFCPANQNLNIIDLPNKKLIIIYVLEVETYQVGHYAQLLLIVVVKIHENYF